MINPPLEIVDIPIGKLVFWPLNPRKTFKPEKQLDLENSLKAHGFTLSVILVRPLPSNYYCVQDEEAGLASVFLRDDFGDGSHVETCATLREAQERIEALSNRFEIILGERRVRGAKEVGFQSAPCFARILSDSKAMEVALAENVARADLSPMEEADAYARMLKMVDDNGAAYTIARIAETVGRSTDAVWRLVSLSVLTGEARAAVESSFLPIFTACLLARIPDEDQRELAARDILHPEMCEAPMTHRMANLHIQEHYVRDLRKAPFDRQDADLVPVKLDADGNRVRGGSCEDCPYRLGNKPDVVVSPRKTQTCTRTSCYEQKAAVGWDRRCAKETDPEAGRVALSERECRELYPSGDQLVHNSGMVDLAEFPDGRVLRAGAEPRGTWAVLTQGTSLEVTVAWDRNGKRHELVNRDLAIAAADAVNGHRIFKVSKVVPVVAPPVVECAPAVVVNIKPADVQASHAAAKVTSEAEQEIEGDDQSADDVTPKVSGSDRNKIELIFARKLRAEVRSKIGAGAVIMREFLRVLACYEIDHIWNIDFICDGRAGIDDYQECSTLSRHQRSVQLKKLVCQMETPEIVALLTEIFIFGANNMPNDDVIPLFANISKIDVDALQRAAVAEAKPPGVVQVKKPRAAKAKKAGKQ